MISRFMNSVPTLALGSAVSIYIFLLIITTALWRRYDWPTLSTRTQWLRQHLWLIQGQVTRDVCSQNSKPSLAVELSLSHYLAAHNGLETHLHGRHMIFLPLGPHPWPGIFVLGNCLFLGAFDRPHNFHFFPRSSEGCTLTQARPSLLPWRH